MKKQIHRFIISVSLTASLLAPSALYALGGHSEAQGNISYLLSIDRLDYYNKALADNLSGKQDPQLVNDLYSLTVEDYLKVKPDIKKLNSIEQWNQITSEILIAKYPQREYHKNIQNSLIWNYNFLKNKLLERYKTRDFADSGFSWGEFVGEDSPTQRSVPKIKGQKILLDYERYIAEKTSRAIIWDAILNDRDFEFHIGTEKDFQESIKKTGLQIVQEVLPMARNYNKIYLAFDSKRQKYTYVINQISGDDRVKHLAAQLRLIQVNGKKYFANSDKVRVFGSSKQLHAKIEAQLVDVFSRLPKADRIIIGQKGAIEDAIRSAGMMEVVQAEMPQIFEKLNLPQAKENKFKKLSEQIGKMGPFLDDVFAPGPVDLAEAVKLTNDPFVRNYTQFNSEQISHDFSDYLLQDKEGRIQRWRVFSAVWGDEIIPIAKALRRSGNDHNVVYIGTAGALADKGLKVGDLVGGQKVQTHEGKMLDFSTAKLVDPKMNKFTIGQVYTPFDETDTWLKKQKNVIDVVEVETGYLRQHLGPQANLQAYFLISDVVGSETETLAHAATNSGKRKKAQLQLLESLFQESGIVSPVANFEMIKNNAAFSKAFKAVQKLRASRDILSQKQVAHLAIKKGIVTEEALEALLKSQKTFGRDELSTTLNTLDAILNEVQKSVPQAKRLGLVSETLFDGTFNPKMNESIKLVIEGMSAEQAIKQIGEKRWNNLSAQLPKNLSLQVISDGTPEALIADREFFRNKGSFVEKYEEKVMKSYGFIFELDAKGMYRTKEIPGMGSALRCEAILL